MADMVDHGLFQSINLEDESTWFLDIAIPLVMFAVSDLF